MQALPIFLNIANRLCVVIGGGEVALRKVTTLLKANAAVKLYAPEICPALQALVDTGDVQFEAQPFAASQLNGACLVIAATDDEAVNVAVSEAAKARNIPVNVVDSPALCTFTMASIVR